MERARKTRRECTNGESQKDKERIVGTELHQWRGENNFAEQGENSLEFCISTACRRSTFAFAIFCYWFSRYPHIWILLATFPLLRFCLLLFLLLFHYWFWLLLLLLIFFATDFDCFLLLLGGNKDFDCY